MTSIRIDVMSASGAYPVIIGAGTLDVLPRLLEETAPGGRPVVVSSPRVWDLHHRALTALAGPGGAVLVSDGERSKTLATVNRIYEALITRGADRSGVIVAVGGGVIGDMVGFAAATYLRGVRLIQVPTTLMAQVDSAIGGKVGVNHALGKNLIGAFHPPRLVAADPDVLVTLPRREFRAGLYEVIKYGVIANPALIERIAGSRTRLFARDSELLTELIAESCRIKARVVSADERETGLRRVLNFGHTIGHALEAVTKYRRYRHGEAVAYGMLAALALGVARGITPPAARDTVAQLVGAMGPLPPVADLSMQEILRAVGHDKKIVAGTLHFIVAADLGKTVEIEDVRPDELQAALNAIGIVRT